MRLMLKVIALAVICSSIVFGQELTRDQKLEKIDELISQIKILEADVLSPADTDLQKAQKEGVNVFRLMPRENYDRKLTINGGAFYSFARKSSEYGSGSDIALEQNNLSVGFAGADYGFIYDLGEISLAEVSGNTSEARFLLNYKPPTNEVDVRNEARKTYNYDVDGVIYKSHIPNIIGHTYLLRSINFGDWDILVAIKIHRKDTDGSLIIFWKLLENFEKPTFERKQ